MVEWTQLFPTFTNIKEEFSQESISEFLKVNMPGDCQVEMKYKEAVHALFSLKGNFKREFYLSETINIVHHIDFSMSQHWC